MKPKAIYSAEPAKGWLPWGALAPVLLIVFVAVPDILASLALKPVQLVDAKGDPVGLAGLCAFLVIPFGLTGLLVFAWVHFVERRPLRTIGLVGAKGASTFWRGHAIGVAMICGLVGAIWTAGGFEAAGFGKALGSPSALMNIGLLLLCFAVQSSVEEIIFRGWLFSVTARKFNVAVGMAITSITFALLHYEPHQHWIITLAIVLFSIFACCWSLQTGNIWGVMGWHAGWNWFLAVGFELPVTSIDVKQPALLVKLLPIGSAFLTGGPQGPEGSYFCSLVFVAAITFVLWRSREKRPALDRASASQHVE